MKKCPITWSQQKGTVEPQNNFNSLQLGEQADAKDGKVIVDYKPDVVYEQEGPDPNDEPDT